MKKSIRTIPKKLLLTFVVIFLLAWTLLPFYSLIITSLSPSRELPTKLSELSKNLSTKFYKEVLLNPITALWKNMLNSVVVASIVTIVVLIAAVFSGYSFSRSNFPESKGIFYFLLIVKMVPSILLVIPIYLIAVRLKIMDTYWGLVLAYIPFNIPLAIWLMKGFFDIVPFDLEEAAWIDGATMPRTIFSVILPLVMPGVAVTAVFVFLSSYTEYLFAVTLSRSNMITLSIKIAGFMTPHRIDFQAMGASAIVSTIPMILMFIYIRRYIVEGLTFGAIK
ncbi:MAG: carbohydrate ABC transporter permease [Actinobacteria bacterium]|nr:carbohydrate ABC transporter permease [Actinomycetota bacterium]